jgi:hypothetical protein
MVSQMVLIVGSDMRDVTAAPHDLPARKKLDKVVLKLG